MKEYIIFLQPMNNILEVVRAAKGRGYSVIALVSGVIPSLPPYGSAISCIDHIVEIDNWDDHQFIIGAIDNIVLEGSVVGTYFGIEPVAVLNAVLRENYDLPGNSIDTVKLITNKLMVRSALIEAGLSNLKYVKNEEFSKWVSWSLNDVYYFKPSYGSGSVCVKRCSSLEDLQIALSVWNEYANHCDEADVHLDKYHLFSGRENSYYLEEEIQGELLSLEGICHDGEFYSLGLLSRILFSENAVVEMGSCFPYPHPDIEEIIKKVIEVHKTLGIKFGATHTELIVGVDGRIEIIDLNPRFVGADVMMSINNAYGISIQEFLLDSALGKKPNLHVDKENSRFACLQYVLAPADLDVFISLGLPQEKDVAFTRVCLPSNTNLQSTDTQSDVLGAYLVVGDSFDSAIKRSQQLRSKVLINGVLPGRF